MPLEVTVPFENEEQHYKHVNSALAQYTTEYVEAADTSSINRNDLDKTSLEANKFLRTIKQITTDSELKSQCDVLMGYINEGIYAQLPRYLKALSREYKNDRARMKQDEYSLQNKISELLGEYQTMNKEQFRGGERPKRPPVRSFLRLWPDVAVVTSADADHLDIYGTHEALREAFSQFVGQIREGGALVVKRGVDLKIGNLP